MQPVTQNTHRPPSANRKPPASNCKTHDHELRKISITRMQTGVRVEERLGLWPQKDKLRLLTLLSDPGNERAFSSHRKDKFRSVDHVSTRHFSCQG